MDYFADYTQYPHGSYNHPQYLPNNGYQFNVNPVAEWRRHPMLHHGARTTESKPRLAKEEVDKLESEFRRNHKPNSSLKKQLAEEMRVDIARINNWFQNRRAKAKQEKRAQENEARRKFEQEASESPAQDAVKEYYPDGDHHDDLRPSAAPFPSVETSASSDDSSTTTLSAKAPEDTDSDARSPAVPDFNIKQEQVYEHFQPPVDSLLFPSQSTCDFSSIDTESVGSIAPGSLTLTIPTQLSASLHNPSSADSYAAFHGLSGLPNSGELDSVAPLPSQYSSDMSRGSHGLDAEDDQNEQFSRFSHLSPESAHSPMSTGSGLTAFKSPAIDIASRRNTKRPAQLGVGCMRSYSYNHPGMKTGIEMPRRMEAPSPMRRVASATGTMPRGIQKSVGMGPRSPLYFDRNQELLLHIASQTPIPQGPGSSVAPPTPNTPVIVSQQARELTLSSEDDKRYTFQAVQAGLMSASFNTDPTMRTPPDTPGLMGNYSSAVFPNSHLQATFDYNVIDEPLVTPGLGSFDNDFPTLPTNLPTYISQSCSSQPSTPSYPSTAMGPAFFPSFAGGNPEYNWSDASARSSPGHISRARQFQFTNMTAQDFHEE